MGCPDPATLKAPLCPSAQPEMAESQVLGVIENSANGSRVAYLNERLPATAQIVRMTAPIAPTEVFRFAARCEERKCTHFDGARCKLATRIVEHLEPVVATLPACMIRAKCRWFQQEGRDACYRCPQVVTLTHEPAATLQQVAEAVR